MGRCCGEYENNWHGRFRCCGRRMTQPRQLILDYLRDHCGHLSAEEIFNGLRGRLPSLAVTTVYRTLETLTELGILSRFSVGDGKARYEFAEGPGGLGHHHHLVCTGCGRIIDYTEFINEETELLKNTEEGLSKKYNFQIRSHQLYFYGLCDKCRK